ncbi:unnamed protein product [Moneuplotes crassus]|uniref:Uncharacterized protein n=1 Tax=Euplotes crassus TaxID=5936 RepID=A0AAD1XJK9_EUPCR|nr:unnamed protein product [Moneuplotes crassus]
MPFYSFFNIFEEAKSVLQGLHSSSGVQEEPIIDETLLNINLLKQENDGKFDLKYLSGTKFKRFNFQRRGKCRHTRHEMPLSHSVGKNFWILKATNLNRGRGIHVFNSLESLKALIHEQWNCSENPDPKERSSGKTSVMMIIQKYIEKPLLIHKRKFDIRVWVFVSSAGKCYFFKEGYLRTSGSEFTLDDTNPDDQFVHLTNNAIQKYAQNYGDFEDGNQMSFENFQKYIDEHYPERGYNFKRDGLPRMKEIIMHSLLSVRRKLNPNNRKFCFELFGYDFIMDSDFNLWLIEVNTNPCLEESSEMLKHYLRRMINDMIKLEIDPKFPKPRKNKRYDKISKKSTLNNSPPNRQKSASLRNNQTLERKLSYGNNQKESHRSPEKEPNICKNDDTKSSISRYLTCRSTNEGSIQPKPGIYLKKTSDDPNIIDQNYSSELKRLASRDAKLAFLVNKGC